MDQSISGNTGDIKITVLGVASVGKSSLTVRFIYKTFTEEYTPTL